MTDNGSDEKHEATLKNARWEIRQLLLGMASSVVDAAEAEKRSRPYQVGLSSLHYWWLKKVAGDLVERVESGAGNVYRAEVSPHMLRMAQTVLEVADGKDPEEASATARRIWGGSAASARAHAPRAVEEIQLWMGRNIINASSIDLVLCVLQEKSPGLTEGEFRETFEARHTSGPDHAAWQRLASHLGVGEDEIAELLTRRAKDGSR